MNKHDKIKALNIDNITIDELSDEFVDTLYDKYVVKNNKRDGKTKKVKKNPAKIIDKTTRKYKILIKFVNKILVNIGKDRIDDLTDFKNIDRLDIIKPENKVILDEMESDLYRYFAKKSNFYRKTPSIVLIIIRGLCKQVGLRFVSTQKDIRERINGKLYRRTHMFYSIKNI